MKVSLATLKFLSPLQSRENRIVIFQCIVCQRALFSHLQKVASTGWPFGWIILNGSLPLFSLFPKQNMFICFLGFLQTKKEKKKFYLTLSPAGSLPRKKSPKHCVFFPKGTCLFFPDSLGFLSIQWISHCFWSVNMKQHFIQWNVTCILNEHHINTLVLD